MATPPINATGVYIVREPFVVEKDAIYKCEGIQGFESLEHQAVDVFISHYAPFGLTEEDFERDSQVGVDIVWLLSDEAEPVVIPSSYIEEFPQAGDVDYRQFFITMNLGPLPAGTSLTYLEGELVDRVKAEVGVTPQIRTVTNNIAGQISVDEHEQLSAVRQAMKEVEPSNQQRFITAIKELVAQRKKTQLLEEEIDRLNNL